MTHATAKRLYDQVDTYDMPDFEGDFASLLDDSLGDRENFEGTVVEGTVIDISENYAMVDVGLKSEGLIPLEEFSPSGEVEINVGDTIDVYVERMEDINGNAVLSREKALREKAWEQLENANEHDERISGIIYKQVKGGYMVDLNGAVAFLPGSQVDIRPVKDISPLMGTPQPFHILNMDRSRSNIVVSRRAVLEESRSEARDELVDDLKEGQIREGVVKNITDYGAFIDLGGVDGLLHVTDLAWRRVSHPSDVLSIGQSVEVQVVRFDKEKERISLGMKQLQQDPWEQVQENYPVGGKFTGRVTNITDYGAFVALEPGVEGLVHVSEMSWTNKNVHPSKVVSTSQEVEVAILDVDTERRRISLGIKQTRENPWISFANEHPPGSEITGTVKNITEFGMFVGLPENIDGMVHLSDLSWELDGEEAVKKFDVGDEIQVKILDVDTDRERVSLGIKQLEDDPFAEAIDGINQNDVITVTVNKVQDDGIEVTVKDDVTGWIPKHELARERSEQRPDRFAVGDTIDARITNIDRRNRKISLSVKKREIAEEKEAMQKYGSKDSGASLGDILGQALGGAEPTEEGEEELVEAEAEAEAEEAQAETTEKAEEAEVEAEDTEAEESEAKSEEAEEDESATEAEDTEAEDATEAKDAEDTEDTQTASDDKAEKEEAEIAEKEEEEKDKE